VGLVGQVEMEQPEPALFLLKRGPVFGDRTDTVRRPDDDEDFSRIRCPLCEWRPNRSHTWQCITGPGNPEGSFIGCGTSWNTFATRGRCPGCAHQWRWTSCLRCSEWSLHVDWYEEGT
jgi:hypothetical protein